MAAKVPFSKRWIKPEVTSHFLLEIDSHGCGFAFEIQQLCCGCFDGVHSWPRNCMHCIFESVKFHINCRFLRFSMWSKVTCFIFLKISWRRSESWKIVVESDDWFKDVINRSTHFLLLSRQLLALLDSRWLGTLLSTLMSGAHSLIMLLSCTCFFLLLQVKWVDVRKSSIVTMLNIL